METIRQNPRRIILIGLVILVLICLVGVLIYRIFTAENEVAGGGTPTPTSAATQEATAAATTEVEAPTAEVTPTPTRVISAQPSATPTKQATTAAAVITSTAKASVTPKATPTPPAAPSQVTTVVVKPGPLENLLKNGDFEQGFDSGGVALNWQAFKNDSVQAAYGRETAPYVESGVSAQRINLVEASAYNRYAGISQQVEVVSGQVYTLTLHGQIRSIPGDVTKSSFGYRLQYAVSLAALKNWQNVPEAEWVELPWDEQPLNTAATQLYSYTTTIQPTSDKLTLFVRAWNKWPDPGEAQYTLDSFSLVGPTLISETIIASVSPTTTVSAIAPPTPMTTTGQGNRPLPVTGADDGSSLMQDGRFWIGLLMVLLLAVGAIFRAKWSY